MLLISFLRFLDRTQWWLLVADHLRPFQTKLLCIYEIENYVCTSICKFKCWFMIDSWISSKFCSKTDKWYTFPVPSKVYAESYICNTLCQKMHLICGSVVFGTCSCTDLSTTVIQGKWFDNSVLVVHHVQFLQDGLLWIRQINDS